MTWGVAAQRPAAAGWKRIRSVSKSAPAGSVRAWGGTRKRAASVPVDSIPVTTSGNWPGLDSGQTCSAHSPTLTSPNCRESGSCRAGVGAAGALGGPGAMGAGGQGARAISPPGYRGTWCVTRCLGGIPEPAPGPAHAGAATHSSIPHAHTPDSSLLLWLFVRRPTWCNGYGPVYIGILAAEQDPEWPGRRSGRPVRLAR